MRNPQLKRAYAEEEYSPQSLMDFKRCMTDPIFFMKKYVKVVHPKLGAVPFELYDYQEEMVMAIHENKDTILLCSRQMGKTTVAAMYILWFALFNDTKTCIIASKAMGHATEIMSRVKFAYEQLPGWLKAGVKYYSRTSIEFDNGSKIKCEATSEKTGRGDSPAVLFVDELAFINRRIQDEMWSSLTPALSAGGKFILTSTPNGDSDLFATVWRQAMAGLNSFKPLQYLWWRHPDRDQKYYDEMLGKLGPVKTRQEIDCEFLSSDALLINSLVLHGLRFKAPLYESLGFKFWVPEEELGGRGKTYLVSCDPATGSGNDASVIEVFEFPSLNQVAEYRTTEVKIPLLYAKLKWIINQLSASKGGGRAEVLWTFERNGIGEALSALYQNDDKQPEHAEHFSDNPLKYGVFTSGKTKVLSCLHLKQLVEKVGGGGLQVNSEHLLFELKNFVAKGGGYEAKAGASDDAVMAVVGILRLLKRLADYDDRAFRQVNEYVDAEGGEGDTGDPVPFLIV